MCGGRLPSGTTTMVGCRTANGGTVAAVRRFAVLTALLVAGLPVSETALATVGDGLPGRRQGGVMTPVGEARGFQITFGEGAGLRGSTATKSPQRWSSRSFAERMDRSADEGSGALGSSVAPPLTAPPPPPGDGWRLKLAQVFFRHGDRTPVCLDDTLCPLSEPLSESQWSAAVSGKAATQPEEIFERRFRDRLPEAALSKGMAGQLTDKGVRQAQDLGRSIRRTYVDELQALPPQMEHPDMELMVRSTSTVRTVETLLFALSEVYPDDYTRLLVRIVNEPLRLSHEADSMVRALAMRSDEAKQKLLPKVDEFGRGSLGLDRQLGVEEASYLYDTVNCRKAHGLPLPSVLAEGASRTHQDSDTVLRSLGKLVDEADSLMYEAQRDVDHDASPRGMHIADDLAADAVANMRKKLDTPCRCAVYLNSCHDTTLQNFLRVVGHPYSLADVPYTSHLQVVLWEKVANSRGRKGGQGADAGVDDEGVDDDRREREGVSRSDTKTYAVTVVMNGNPVFLKGCAAAGGRADFCTFDAFEKMMKMKSSGGGKTATILEGRPSSQRQRTK